MELARNGRFQQWNQGVWSRLVREPSVPGNAHVWAKSHLDISNSAALFDRLCELG